MPSHDHLWDEHEVARYLNVSNYTVRNWRQKGLIGYTRLGGVIRYLPEEIKRFAESGRRAPRCPSCGNNSVNHAIAHLPAVASSEAPYFQTVATG